MTSDPDTRTAPPPRVRGAVVFPCAELGPTLGFFTALGFRVDAIHPADHPTTAELSGFGIALRLEPGPVAGAAGVVLRLTGDGRWWEGDDELVAPNGVVVRRVASHRGPVIPPLDPALVVTHADGDDSWGVGRAGMRYRDLLPGRLGGRFIASHIAIPDGGPVPDYVHYHRIRFQLIFCRRGWARLVYEDQGEPFLMRAGDCVLQPPEIRHRVLESSDGLEVVEVGCPAEHETFADHELALPTGVVHADRDFGGQRFVRHDATAARWEAWRHDGFEQRDTGIGAATGGLAGVRVVRPLAPDASTPPATHDAELLFGFVLDGSATLVAGGAEHALRGASSFAVPAGLPFALERCSADLELLEVTLPEQLAFA